MTGTYLSHFGGMLGTGIGPGPCTSGFSSGFGGASSLPNKDDSLGSSNIFGITVSSFGLPPGPGGVR